MAEKIQSSLPPQIERQQPVLLLDACGRLAPMHLEFINSKEAFLAVLRVRFKNRGLSKIERGEFAIQETGAKRDIDLSLPWEICIFPGQKIDMSMIFKQAKAGRSDTCPACKRPCAETIDEDVEW